MRHSLEENIAHLTRSVDELSDELARLARRAETLERRVQLLLERAAEAEAQGPASPPPDQRPPHW
jgi:SlyX protein